MNKKILTWNDKETILKLVQSLKNNNTCLTSTDTVLGLLADITKSGSNSLNNIKNRDEKPYIILINSIEKIYKFTDQKIGPNLEKLMKNCWPGPLTLIFKSKQNVFDNLKTFEKSIAIRIPNHFGLLQLLTYFDGLFSTSANLSGQKIPEFLNEIDPKIVNSVDYIVLDDNLSNHRYPIIPSTILDCTGEKIKVIREGAYSIKELEKIYEEEFKKN